MRRVISQLSMALMLVSLAGCGLKGPLYFPPADKPQQNDKPTEQQQQAAQQADTGGLVTGSSSGVQSN
ncbi:LPS translocon maturation chaperone LptM [Pantoea sp. UBA6567]|uniref:LPS translocon maturation chaperone LptM n=1 Tax=Pantoea sp. UBA6567 TaxID=1947043 RepID=UPI002598BD98|nr:lipoprotein [Pantoea sp. UBA6567]